MEIVIQRPIGINLLLLTVYFTQFQAEMIFPADSWYSHITVFESSVFQ